MSTALLTVVLGAGLAVLALVTNHMQARIALIEVTLNEGLPPGHDRARTPRSPASFDTTRAQQVLGQGLHLFVSRGCLACQRLLEELDAPELVIDTDVHLRCVDRPRPIAVEIAERLGAHLHRDQQSLAEDLGVDPLPHAVAIGPSGLVAHGATPSLDRVLATARDAGIRPARRQSPTP